MKVSWVCWFKISCAVNLSTSTSAASPAGSNYTEHELGAAAECCLVQPRHCQHGSPCLLKQLCVARCTSCCWYTLTLRLHCRLSSWRMEIWVISHFQCCQNSSNILSWQYIWVAISYKVPSIQKNIFTLMGSHIDNSENSIIMSFNDKKIIY